MNLIGYSKSTHCSYTTRKLVLSGHKVYGVLFFYLLIIFPSFVQYWRVHFLSINSSYYDHHIDIKIYISSYFYLCPTQTSILGASLCGDEADN